MASKDLALGRTQGVTAVDKQLLGLAFAALGTAEAQQYTREELAARVELPPPIYIGLRRKLTRSGEITSSTVPHWPASDW